MGAERRREHRHEKRIEVLLTVEDIGYAGTTRNLSLGGAFVEVDLNIPTIRDPNVEITFFLPDEDGVCPMSCAGRICWLEGVLPNGTGFGIQFQDLTQKQIDTLETFFTNTEETEEPTTSAQRAAIESSLSRWVENGLLSQEDAEAYRKRRLED